MRNYARPSHCNQIKTYSVKRACILKDQHTNVDVLQLRVEEEEVNLQLSRDHEVELCQTLRLQVEDLQKRLEEKDNKLTQANEVRPVC